MKIFTHETNQDHIPGILDSKVEFEKALRIHGLLKFVNDIEIDSINHKVNIQISHRYPKESCFSEIIYNKIIEFCEFCEKAKIPGTIIGIEVNLLL